MPDTTLREPDVTPELAREHGLTDEEYGWVVEKLGRTPTFVELGIYSVMWSEHCSYKNSIALLKTLPREGENLLVGAGEENAGLVDIGDGLAVAFKIESHNHPSAVEPYQGAATGVGGIQRDIFTMGARPVCSLNSLRFGSLDNPRVRYLFDGVVRGIGDYGNSFGVPTVAGEVYFDSSYEGNPLVNAMSVGVVKVGETASAIATGVGNPVYIVGSATGRDGIHGATFASEEISEESESKRPSVQVGDPFTEKLLLEASLEALATGAVVGIQDMGAAGLTCSAVEMGDKGNLGVRLNLEDVPCREENMTAYEMMLSESQERMLMVLRPEKEAEAKAVFDKWDLDFAIVGETIPEDRFLIMHNNTVKADLPLKALSGNAPEYDRPWAETVAAEPLDPASVPGVDPVDGLRALIASPNYCARHWVYEQYDTMVMADTARTPGQGAGLIRVHGTDKLLAFTSDVTPRYVKANPVEGGKQAVAEAYRNLTALGAVPLATTDNMNFGNPEKPEIMGQFVGAIKGIGAAVSALDMPIVSGNVSLYNETDGQAILPTPTIGAVGLIRDPETAITGEARDGHMAILIGDTAGHLGQSALLAEVYNRVEGDAPPVDLEIEKRNGEFIRANHALIKACTDLSDGGLALAAFEMAEAAGVGVQLDSDDTAFLFGEDQARYLVACNFDQAEALMIEAGRAGVPVQTVGRFTGDTVQFGKSEAALSDLSHQFRTSFGAHFA